MTTLRELIAAGATRAELERAATEAGHGDIVAAHARGTKGELLASLVVALEPPPDTSIPAPGDTSNPGDAAGDTSNPGDAAGDTSNPGDAAGDTSNPGDAAGDTSNAGGEVSRGPRVLTRSEALAPIARELEQLQTAEPPADPVQAARLAMARELAATQLRMMRAAPIGLLTAFVRDTQNDPTAEVIEDPAPPTAADADELRRRIMAGEDPASLGVPSVSGSPGHQKLEPAPVPRPRPPAPPTPEPAPAPVSNVTPAPAPPPAAAFATPMIAAPPPSPGTITPAVSAPPQPPPQVEVPRLAAFVPSPTPQLGGVQSVEVPHLGARSPGAPAGGGTRALIVAYFREVATQGDRIAAELHNGGHLGAAQLVQLVADQGRSALARISG
jgi:hypothetical protein